MTILSKKFLGLLYPSYLILRARGVTANTCPVAENVLCAAFEDTAVNITLIDSNVFDEDNDDLSIVAITQPANGQALIGHDGKYVTFVPYDNFSGFTTFDYTISDGSCPGTAKVYAIVRAINDAPMAEPDNEVTGRGTPVVIDVLANDLDVDLGDFLSIADITSPPANGVATISEDGKAITYTPNDGFIGRDTFEYSVTDGKTVPGTGELYLATAHVNIHVRDEQPVTDLCGAALDSNTAYYLENDVACPQGMGPTLLDDTVLDCRGYSLIGNTNEVDLPGINMAGTGSEVVDCAVSGFHVAIEISGANNVVRNVELSDYGSKSEGGGIRHESDSGPGNAVYCSAISGGTEDGDESYGIRSYSAEPFLISGVEVAGGDLGMLMSSGTIKCADVSDANVGIVLQTGPVVIEESVFNGSGSLGILLAGGDGYSLSDVSSCGNGSQDIFMSGATDSNMILSAGLTCSTVFLGPSCDTSCPFNRLPRLPSTCSVECPVVGLRTNGSG